MDISCPECTEASTGLTKSLAATLHSFLIWARYDEEHGPQSNTTRFHDYSPEAPAIATGIGRSCIWWKQAFSDTLQKSGSEFGSKQLCEVCIVHFSLTILISATMGWRCTIWVSRFVPQLVTVSSEAAGRGSDLFLLGRSKGVLMTRPQNMRRRLKILSNTTDWSISMPGRALFNRIHTVGIHRLELSPWRASSLTFGCFLIELQVHAVCLKVLPSERQPFDSLGLWWEQTLLLFLPLIGSENQV